MSEDQVRDLLGQAAELAPLSLDRQVSTGTPWRARALVAGAAVAASSVAAVAVVATTSSAPRRHDITPPASGETTGPVGDGTRVVSQRGLTLNVPAAWKIGDARCGTPVGDTVMFNIDGVESCGFGGTRSAVDLVSFTQQNSYFAKQHCAGGPERDGLTTCTDPKKDSLGRTVVVVSAEATGESVIISSLDPDRARAFASTARLAKVVDGCEVTPDSLDTPTPSREDAKDSLVPGEPTGLSACSYVDGKLLSSGNEQGAEVTSYAAILDSLQEGRGSAAKYNAASVCNDEKDSAIRLVFSYSTGPSLDVWVHTGGCSKNIGFDNGARTGFPTFEAYTPMFKLVTISGFADPRSLER